MASIQKGSRAAPSPEPEQEETDQQQVRRVRNQRKRRCKEVERSEVKRREEMTSTEVK